jgi:DNA-binding transcriptional MerR regulator
MSLGSTLYQPRKHAERLTLTARVKPTPDADKLMTADIARRAGVSLRQLQWWDEKGVVSPRQEGHKRVYSIEEARKVLVVASLRQKGLSLQSVRKALRKFSTLVSGEVAMYCRGRWWTVPNEKALEAAIMATGAVVVVRIP